MVNESLIEKIKLPFKLARTFSGEKLPTKISVKSYLTTVNLLEKEVLKILAVHREKLQELLNDFPVLDENLFWNQFKKDVEEFREKLVLLFGEESKKEIITR